MNSLFADPLSITVRSISRPAKAPVAPPNFLFIMPQRATQEDHALIFTIADSMAGMGYVYVASVDHTMTEDRGQVRYLPYHSEQLPSFGSLNAVFVLRDRNVAVEALREYPGAEGFLLEPRSDVLDRMGSAAPAYTPRSQNIGAFISLPRSRPAAA